MRSKTFKKIKHFYLFIYAVNFFKLYIEFIQITHKLYIEFIQIIHQLINFIFNIYTGKLQFIFFSNKRYVN